ncbi:MAG: TolC family protein [Gammaproteobacteria bacterium]|nr:TolC family protein [Gammaproteobacteria bacterium]
MKTQLHNLFIARVLKITMASILLLSLSQWGIAKDAPIKLIEQPQPSSNNQWARWVLFQVENLPSLQAINKGSLIASEKRNAMQQPLFNPELGAFYTDKDDEEYGVIVSQKIDWYNKRSATSQLGQVDYELVEINNVIQTEKKLSDALLAYIEYSMAKQLLDIAKNQEVLLTQLLNDLKKREAVGDVGHIDAEMAYLSLAQNLQQISLIELRYRNASANLNKTLNSYSIPVQPDASIWVNTIDKNKIAAYLEKGLTVEYAKKQLEQSISQSKIAQLNKKINPTIGLGAGRDGNENTLLFEISVPLNVRNNFSSEYRSALEKVNQTELEMREQQRLLENEIQLALNNYEQLKSRVLSWKKLTGKRLKKSQKLLDRQWRSGDITTSDYLFSMRQRTDTLIANIELTGEMKKSWIEWLLASSQVQSWLSTF